MVPAGAGAHGGAGARTGASNPVRAVHESGVGEDSGYGGTITSDMATGAAAGAPCPHGGTPPPADTRSLHSSDFVDLPLHAQLQLLGSAIVSGADVSKTEGWRCLTRERKAALLNALSTPQQPEPAGDSGDGSLTHAPEAGGSTHPREVIPVSPFVVTPTPVAPTSECGTGSDTTHQPRHSAARPARKQALFDPRLARRNEEVSQAFAVAKPVSVDARLRWKALNGVRGQRSSKSQLPFERDDVPAGTCFHAQVKRMMVAFGDCFEPSTHAAMAVEAHVIPWLRNVVTSLRVACGGSALNVAVLRKLLPTETRAYFRWRRMRRMAKKSEHHPPPSLSDAKSPGGTNAEGAGGGGVVGAHTPQHAASQRPSAPGPTPRTRRSKRHRPHATGAQRSAKARRRVAGEDSGSTGKTEEARCDHHGAVRREVGEAAAASDSPIAGDAGAGGAPAGVDSEDDVVGDSSDSELEDESLSGDDGLECTTLQRRLEFANRRTVAMGSLEYHMFTKCRETGFIRSHNDTRLAALLPPPSPPRKVMHVLGFLAYCRVGDVVEEALRVIAGGSSTPAAQSDSTPAALVAATDPIPAATIEAAIARLAAAPVLAASQVAK